jgi:hypothetical protein
LCPVVYYTLPGGAELQGLEHGVSE